MSVLRFIYFFCKCLKITINYTLTLNISLRCRLRFFLIERAGATFKPRKAIYNSHFSPSPKHHTPTLEHINTRMMMRMQNNYNLISIAIIKKQIQNYWIRVNCNNTRRTISKIQIERKTNETLNPKWSLNSKSSSSLHFTSDPPFNSQT